MANNIDDFITDGTLVPLTPKPGLREYYLPGLRHHTMTWAGRQTITYLLTVKEQAEPGKRYTVSTDSDYSRGEVVFNTDDFAALASWIKERMAKEAT